jgi:Disulphide bond corrector protein DsbC/Thioredoxin-like
MRRFKLLNISSRVLLLWIAAMSPLCASRLNPVSWSLIAEQGKVAPGSTIVLRLHAQIQDGYHLYSFTTPGGGPIKTTVSLQAGSDIKGLRIYQPTPDRHRDPNLNVPVETFKNGVDFLLRTTLHKSALSGEKVVTASVRYQACSDVICLPPVTNVATTTIGIESGTAATPTRIPAGYQFVGGSAIRAARSAESATPPIDLHFLLLAFGFGLATLFTPCVFPMIPLTIIFRQGIEPGARPRVSKSGLVLRIDHRSVLDAGSRRHGRGRTVRSGSIGEQPMGEWVYLACVRRAGIEPARRLRNRVALSPADAGRSSLSRQRCSLDSVADINILPDVLCVRRPVRGNVAGGIDSDCGMGARTRNARLRGWTGDAFLLTCAVSVVSKKTTPQRALVGTDQNGCRFIVLAASFKYLANVDEVLHWGLLTRERILAIWFSLLLAAALYLLGQLRFHAALSQSDLSLSRLLAGLAVLAFAVSLLPGLWGRKLADLEAFLPTDEQTTVPADVTHASYSGPAWRKDDYEGAVAEAKLEHKPLLISFSGYTCTNCHWMKANIFPQPTVVAALENYVLVELYTDGTDAASERNQKLEQAKFGTIALPYYVISDADGHELAHEDGLTRDVNQFLEFLHTGLASGFCCTWISWQERFSKWNGSLNGSCVERGIAPLGFFS